MLNKKKLIVSGLLWVIILNIFIPTLNYFISDSLSTTLKTLDEFYVLLLFLITLIYRRNNKKILILIVLYFLVGIISGLSNGASWLVLISGFSLSIKGIILMYCLIQWRIDKIQLLYFFRKFKILFFVIVVFFFFDLFLGESFKRLLELKNENRMGINVANSLFRHPADLAFFAFFWFYYFSSFNENRWLNYLTFIIGTLTFRVKDIGAALLVLILNFKKNKGVLKRIIILLPTAVILLQAYIFLLPAHYEQYFGRDDENPVARVALYLTSLKIAENEFPFGEGFGRYGGEISAANYSPVYEEYGIAKIQGINPEEDGVNYISDTYWPMILGESGVIGFFIYCYLLFILFKPIFYYRSEDIIFENFVIFSKKLLFSSIIVLLARPIFTAPPMYLMIFGVIGLVISSMRNTEHQL